MRNELLHLFPRQFALLLDSVLIVGTELVIQELLLEIHLNKGDESAIKPIELVWDPHERNFKFEKFHTFLFIEIYLLL